MKITVVLLIIPSILFSQRVDGKNGTIEYSKLEKAYKNYDTIFFQSLSDSTFQIKDGNKSIRSFVSGLSPILDWQLNKKADLSEYNYWTKNNHFILEIYCLKTCDKKLIFDFQITGNKPQIIFKKGKGNWYKIKELKHILLIKSVEMKTDENYEIIP